MSRFIWKNKQFHMSYTYVIFVERHYFLSSKWCTSPWPSQFSCHSLFLFHCYCRFPFASSPGLLSSALSSAFSLSAEDQVCPIPPSMLPCLKDTGIRYVTTVGLTCMYMCLHELCSSGPSRDASDITPPSPPAGPEAR